MTYVWTHCFAWNVENNKVTYFDCFGVGLVQKKIKKFIGDKSIKVNIVSEYSKY